MTEPPRHSENARQALHVAMGGCALFLRWLTWPQAVALAAGALLFNLFVLPQIGRRLYRPGDRPASLDGIVYYPIAVLALLLLFPRRPDIVAAAWGILAAGDGLATIVGRAAGEPRWPWNHEKTVAGSVAFLIGGAVAGDLLALWCRPMDVPRAFAEIVVPIAALVAALVETIPVRLDDNVSVGLSAGGVLWVGAMIVARHVAYARGDFQESEYFVLPSPGWRVAIAAAVNAIVAILGYLARTVSVSGAMCGAALGTIIFVGLGWQGWTLLMITFIAASVASRLGLTRKEGLGIAEDRGGRRGAGNAIANTGVAAIAALLAGADVHPALARVVFAVALTAGGSDTIASEMGKAFGRRTWSITTLRRVPPGTSGAMSVEGTLAGVAGAIGLAAAGVALSIVPLTALVPIVIAATLAALLESWLGATLEAPGYLNNDLLNFINTGAAAFAAVVIVRWL